MNNLRFISGGQISANLDFPDFIEALREGFRADIAAPQRHHHTIEKPDQANATMLLMPAWTDSNNTRPIDGGYIGVKIANVFPGNAKLGKASVQAIYLLSDGDTGEPLALIDGQALTFWRTSCASALASEYLSRENSERLLMVGAGALAPWLVQAHCAVRPIKEILVWNRSRPGAEKLAEELCSKGLNAISTTELQEAVETSDIISVATLSHTPLVKGDWLQAGAHLDLVGGFTPEMREADNAAIVKASLFVDTMSGALSEPGDIVQPIAEGVITKNDICADLFDLTRNKHAGRMSEEEITLFKSTGASLEDLAAAILVSNSVN